MKLPLVYYGNPILRQKCARIDAITDEVRQLVADMEETMFAHDGIGLAAPQIGRSIAVFVRNIHTQAANGEWIAGTTEVFINPKIIKYSDLEEWRNEGCLSIPSIYGEVCRPVHITVEATDLEGNRFTNQPTLTRLTLVQLDCESLDLA